MRSIALCVALALAGCSNEGVKDDPCPRGICTNPSSGASGAVSGSTGAMTGSAAQGSTGSGGCMEQWQCTPWMDAGGGMFTRTCVDGNMCGTTNGKPNEGPVALPNLDKNYYECN